jgi:hypothetical protein
MLTCQGLHADVAACDGCHLVAASTTGLRSAAASTLTCVSNTVPQGDVRPLIRTNVSPSTTCSTATRGPGVLCPTLPRRGCLYSQGSTATPSVTSKPLYPGAVPNIGSVTLQGEPAGDHRVATGLPSLRDGMTQAAETACDVNMLCMQVSPTAHGIPSILMPPVQQQPFHPSNPWSLLWLLHHMQQQVQVHASHNARIRSAYLSCDQNSVEPSLEAATHS